MCMFISIKICLVTDLKYFHNKKVRLRERKRHTAHRVVSTPSVVLTGYPPPPVLTWQSTHAPRQGYPSPPAGPGRVPPLPAGPGRVPPPPPPGVCKALWDMGTPPVDRQIDGWKDRHVSKHYLPVVLRTRPVKKIRIRKIHKPDICLVEKLLEAFTSITSCVVQYEMLQMSSNSRNISLNNI